MGFAARTRILVSVFLSVALTAGAFFCSVSLAAGSVVSLSGGDRAIPQPPKRIISLAPSITEVLFALDEGDKVVGVTRFCDYPPETAGIAKVGGYFDINYEAILSLEPDLVILLSEHEEARVRLLKMGMNVMTVDHSSVDGIMDSIDRVARIIGADAAGTRLYSELEKRIGKVTAAVEGTLRPRVMVAVGRRMDGGNMGEIYVSGRDGFYDELITLAGGVNAYQDRTLKFPALSAEGIIRLNPEIIVEMVPDAKGDDARSRLASHWLSLPSIEAVDDGRVYIFTEDYVVVPGPRFILLLEELARVLHPEHDWGQP